MNLSRFIEATNLNPVITGKEVDLLIYQAKELNTYGVCIPPFWVKRASREIANMDLQLITVIGFPLGYQMTETKLEEAKLALRDGANELDMVMNLSAFRAGMPWAKIEIAKMANFVHDQDAILKVIIEVQTWTDEEIIGACRLCADAGVDFVKTSTGFINTAGVTSEHVKLLREYLPSNVGIKASGGIKSKDQALQLIKAGADRLGTSKTADILKK